MLKRVFVKKAFILSLACGYAAFVVPPNMVVAGSMGSNNVSGHYGSVHSHNGNSRVINAPKYNVAAPVKPMNMPHKPVMPVNMVHNVVPSHYNAGIPHARMHPASHYPQMQHHQVHSNQANAQQLQTRHSYKRGMRRVDMQKSVTQNDVILSSGGYYGASSAYAAPYQAQPYQTLPYQTLPYQAYSYPSYYEYPSYPYAGQNGISVPAALPKLIQVEAVGYDEPYGLRHRKSYRHSKKHTQNARYSKHRKYHSMKSSYRYDNMPNVVYGAGYVSPYQTSHSSHYGVSTTDPYTPNVVRVRVRKD